jgi:uncharacterized protein YegL
MSVKQANNNESVTDIIYIIDRSGSMVNLMSDAIGGFNTFLKEQQAIPGECYLTLIAFDTVYETIYNRVPIATAKELTNKDINARAATALLDAVGKALSSMPDDWRVVVFIMTDGEENSSVEWRYDTVKQLVSSKIEKGWDINFVGVGIDAFTVGAMMGILHDKTMNVSASAQGIQDYNMNYSTISTEYRNKK